MSIITLTDVEALESTPFEAIGLPESTYQALLDSAAEHGDRTALTFLLEGDPQEAAVRYSYRDLISWINRTANALFSLEVGAKDAVAIMLPNLPQAVFSIWGAQAAGIACPINPMLEPRAIAEIIEEAGARVLITLAPFPGSDTWEKVGEIQRRAPGLKNVLAVDPAHFFPEAKRRALVEERPNYLTDNVVDFDQLVAAQPGDRLLSGRQIASDETAAFFLTGGTTGRPKLAVHSHRNELANAWAMGQYGACTERDVVLCGLPLFHVNAVLATGLAPFSKGAQVVLAGMAGYRSAPVIPNFWTLIERFGVTYFSAVPTIVSALLQVPIAERDVSSLRMAVCGAAPMSVEVIREFERRTGLIVIEGYGQSEGACLTSANPLEGERRVGSVGLRAPYMQVRVVELNAQGKVERDCAVNEIGCLAIKGPHVFSGYLDPEKNDDIWVDDGWFNTGDLGRIDENGYIWLTGRSKDLIIRGGHNIDPAVIEEVLHQHPAVELAAAVGQPDPRVGELPVAYVQARPGAVIDTSELLNFVKAEIEERAAIPRTIYLLDKMPLTAVGKIFKPTLRMDAILRVVSNELQPLEQQYGPLDIEVVEDSRRGQLIKIVCAGLHAATDALEAKIKTVLSHYSFSWELFSRD